MSLLLQEIIRAVEEEVKPNLPALTSERKRVEMRATLLAMEKMIKHIRRELLKESKEIRSNRKQKRLEKLARVEDPVMGATPLIN